VYTCGGLSLDPGENWYTKGNFQRKRKEKHGCARKGGKMHSGVRLPVIKKSPYVHEKEKTMGLKKGCEKFGFSWKFAGGGETAKKRNKW